MDDMVSRPFTDPFSSDDADDDDDSSIQSVVSSAQTVAVVVVSSTLTHDDDKVVATETFGSVCRGHAPIRSFPEGFRARPSEERMEDVRRTADDERLSLPLLSPG